MTTSDVIVASDAMRRTDDTLTQVFLWSVYQKTNKWAKFKPVCQKCLPKKLSKS